MPLTGRLGYRSASTSGFRPYLSVTGDPAKTVTDFSNKNGLTFINFRNFIVTIKYDSPVYSFYLYLITGGVLFDGAINFPGPIIV